MPTTDWNWFFSSVAQSAAAIVGIFGAFIITKILANQSAFAEKSRRMRELVTLGEKIADATSRLSFDWYHRHDSASEVEDLEGLLEKDEDAEPETLYEKLRFSPYIARADAIATITRIKSYREDRRKREQEEATRRLEQARSMGLGQAFARSVDSTFLRGTNASMLQHMRPQLSKVRDEIDGLYTEAKHHARVASDFHALVAPHPESSPLITISLILILTLFFVGVIYPLSFMPLPTDWKPALSLSEVPSFLLSLRGVLLELVSALFTTMLAMFFAMNIRLKYPRAQLEQLAEYRSLSKYSQYFSNREDNATHRRAIEG